MVREAFATDVVLELRGSARNMHTEMSVRPAWVGSRLVSQQKGWVGKMPKKTTVASESGSAVKTEERRDADDKPPPAFQNPSIHARSVSDTSADGAALSGAGREDRDDWLWQMRNRVCSLERLMERFPTLKNPDLIAAAAATFPLAITPYYASLIRRLDSTDPIFRMSVPDGDELVDPAFLMDDPLEEDHDMPVPGLVHRYRDRALLIATTACAAYCRHCTRKRVAGHTESCISRVRLSQAADYLSVHPEIHDVIISGGDPFTMRTEMLEQIVRTVRAVPSVEIIRIGTRTPVVMPMRITDELVAMLRRYHPIYVNTHFNHPDELTPDAEAACVRLADAGIPVGNQTVLLRGVNDSAPLLADLFRHLVRVRVRPYYLFQCDLVRGAEHFRTPLTKGIEIMEYLRGRLSGLAIPTFVVDLPHGGGKIPLLPNYVVSASPTHTVLRNYAGSLVSYPEPHPDLALPGQDAAPVPEPAGVWALACGRENTLAGTAPRRRSVRKRPPRPAPVG